ncbi:MAG: hypothetical protein ACREFJ_01025, partial [Acetobacteraceae bacterium]
MNGTNASSRGLGRGLSRRTVLAGGLAGGLAAGGGLISRARAAAPRVLKISHQFPAYTDFRDVLARKFA